MADFHTTFLTVLVQLAAIVAMARCGAVLFRKLGQPEVVGEILAGLLLGPSCLGSLLPEGLTMSASGEGGVALRVLSELGLVLLMFLIGLDFDFHHLRSVGGTAARVAVAGIVLPFASGFALAAAIQPHVAPDVNRLGFLLFFATALSITAIPILGRIMVELGVHKTPLGTLTITAAAIDDGLGWVLLATVGSLVHGGFSVWPVMASLGGLVAFVAATHWAVAPLLLTASARFDRKRHRKADNTEIGLSSSTLVLVAVLVSAAVTSALGVFPILGPFILGAALSRDRRLADGLLAEWRPLVYGLLLPVFFTSTGLRTNIGGLAEPWLWGVCLLVVAAATASKMIGCGAAAWWSGCSPRDTLSVAVMMNTRALMGLVAVNAGRDLGVVPDTVYTMLVIMAVATTVVTMPVLRRTLGDGGLAKGRRVAGEE